MCVRIVGLSLLQAGVCPAYSSCCFPEFRKTSNAFGDDMEEDMEEDCPGSLKAAKLTTCA
jgi:hypothetical protein